MMRRARAAAAGEVGELRASEEACRAELRAWERRHVGLEASLRTETDSFREKAALVRSCTEELRVYREESSLWEASAMRHRAASGIASDDLHTEALEAARLSAKLAAEERARGVAEQSGVTRARLAEV